MGGIIVFNMMDTWGSMPKNQIDDQLISEAITEAITAHEADPTAHMGDGESIDMHRQNEVIDHPAFSIVDDKMLLTNFVLDVPLNAYSSFVKTATGFGRPGYIEFTTGGTMNIYYYAYLPSDDWSGWFPAGIKSPRFDVVGAFSSASNIEAYIGIGDMLADGAVGFKIVNSSLYAVWWDSNPTEHLISLGSFSPSNSNKFSCIVEYGVDIKYFLNDTLLYSLSYPSDIVISSNGICFTLAIKKTSAVNRTMYFNKMLFQQAW